MLIDEIVDFAIMNTRLMSVQYVISIIYASRIVKIVLMICIITRTE